MKFDLTIIICATDCIKAYKVCKNVEETSHAKCQFFIHDNTKDNFPIAKVYNMYARIAKANIILFVHQDVKFIGDTWFDNIKKKFNDKTCGAIGYAGSVYRPKDFFAGWPINQKLSRCNYIQCKEDNVVFSATKKFEEVVNLDGLAIFTTNKCAN